MRVTIKRLLRTERRRLIILSISMSAWFLLMMALVKNATGDMTAKSSMMDSSLTKGFGLGSLVSPDDVIAQLTGVSFNHPIVLAIVGAVTVGLGTRACQGELEQGTLEVTLARAIPRSQYLLGYIAVMVMSVTLLMSVAWASMVGFDRLLAAPGTLYTDRAAEACINAGCVFIGFGALGLLVSVLLRRNVSATFVTVGILTAMFAISFAERIWSVTLLKFIGPLSLFHWFNPGTTLMGIAPRGIDYIVPLSGSVVLFALALWWFERRDL